MSSSDSMKGALAREAFGRVRDEIDGVTIVSSDRPFAHEESAYDAQYELSGLDPKPGQRLTDLLVEQGLTSGTKLLEIGCGTGLLSIGLAASNFFEDIVVTDGSMSFLKITKRKLDAVPTNSQLCLALLTDADLEGVAENYFDVIAMRSVLHHITDFADFATKLLAKLKPGGMLALYEPRAEMFLWMATVAALLPDVAKARGIDLSEEDRKHLDIFVATMQFYLRRDVDKSAGEDKYAFWTTEMLDLAAVGRARIVFRSESDPDDLATLFLDYAKYCMSFPQHLVETMTFVLSDLSQVLSGLLRGCAVPDIAGWYIMLKDN